MHWTLDQSRRSDFQGAARAWRRTLQPQAARSTGPRSAGDPTRISQSPVSTQGRWLAANRIRSQPPAEPSAIAGERGGERVAGDLPRDVRRLGPHRLPDGDGVALPRRLLGDPPPRGNEGQTDGHRPQHGDQDGGQRTASEQSQTLAAHRLRPQHPEPRVGPRHDPTETREQLGTRAADETRDDLDRTIGEAGTPRGVVGNIEGGRPDPAGEPEHIRGHPHDPAFEPAVVDRLAERLALEREGERPRNHRNPFAEDIVGQEFAASGHRETEQPQEPGAHPDAVSFRAGAAPAKGDRRVPVGEGVGISGGLDGGQAFETTRHLFQQLDSLVAAGRRGARAKIHRQFRELRPRETAPSAGEAPRAPAEREGRDQQDGGRRDPERQPARREPECGEW